MKKKDLQTPLLKTPDRESHPIRIDVHKFLNNAIPVEYSYCRGSGCLVGIEKDEGTEVGISGCFLRQENGKTLVKENVLIVLLLACLKNQQQEINKLKTELNILRLYIHNSQ